MTTVSTDVARGRQVMRREVNRRIRDLPESNGPGAIDIFCECGRDRCADRVQIAAETYDEVLATPGHFVVTRHHDHDGTQRLVSRHHGFLVVEREQG